MKKITTIILSLLMGFLIGCTKKELSEVQRSELAFLLISEEIINNPPQEEIIFVSSGYSENGEYLPIPISVLTKLQNLHPKVRDVSESKIINGIPYHKSTNSRGVISFVNIKEIISEKKVSVEVGVYRGFKNREGKVHTMKFKNNKWKITKTTHWMS